MKFFTDANKLLSKMNLTTVVVYKGNENNCCISSHTDDDLCYVFVKGKDTTYNLQEFAFRDWKSLSSIMSSFNDDVKVSYELDGNGYPSLMKLKGGGVNYKHYLQNYSFISNQQELHNQFKKKKFQLGTIEQGNIVFDFDKVKNISKLASLTNESTFKLKQVDSELYLIFGDEARSADNATLLLDALFQDRLTDNELSFPSDYIVSVLTAMKDYESLKIKVFSDKIIISGENDISEKVVIIRGKM